MTERSYGVAPVDGGVWVAVPGRVFSPAAVLELARTLICLVAPALTPEESMQLAATALAAGFTPPPAPPMEGRAPWPGTGPTRIDPPTVEMRRPVPARPAVRAPAPAPAPGRDDDPLEVTRPHHRAPAARPAAARGTRRWRAPRRIGQAVGTLVLLAVLALALALGMVAVLYMLLP